MVPALSVRRGVALFLSALPLVVALACGAGGPPSGPAVALPIGPLDAAPDAMGPADATDAAPRAAEAPHPTTCARDYTPPAKTPRLDVAELQRWTQLAGSPDASANDRAYAEMARANVYFRAGQLDDVLAVLGPLVFEGSPDVAMQAMDLYLAGMNQAGPPCRAQMELDVPKLRQRLCVGGAHDERCERLEIIDFQVRESNALMLSETEPSSAAAAFERLFQDMCRPAKPRFECANVAYNAAILWWRVGNGAKAQALLGAMKDKRNGIDRSPVVKKLECVLAGNDAGAC